MTKRVKQLLKEENGLTHKPVVIKVKRSCESFCDDALEKLNVGPYDFFFERIMREIKNCNELSPEQIVFFLHQKSQICHFNIRLVKPLLKKDVEEIIELYHEKN